MPVKKESSEKGAGLIEWQYPVKYGVAKEVITDVLVLGGGLAGLSAAMGAAKKGMKVALVEKGCISHAGCGGAGIDHWHEATTNPASKVSPEEYTQATIEALGRYNCGIGQYIACRESYDTLLELEKLGMKIRDSEDEFKGAPFRDEKTKFIFAYDYKNSYCITIWVTGMKGALGRGCRELGVEIFERVNAQSLLTEGGKQGGRVVGAIGLNVRTGELIIFRAKATIICTSGETRLWYFSSEQRSIYTNQKPGQIAGEGWTAAWRVGAEFSLFEKSVPLNTGGLAGVDMVPFSGGFWDAEWRACTMVDATGKEIPWFDRDGNPITGVTQRNMPAAGQKFFLPNLFAHPRGISPADKEVLRKYAEPYQMKGMHKRIANGELVPPLYADLPSMPEPERRVVFGLHIGEEGKTKIFYRYLTAAGFDPDKHMLEFNPVAMLPRARTFGFNSGGLVPDWNLRTNLEGLYAAGASLLSGGGAAYSCCTGQYAGRKAAEYAASAAEPVVDRKQLDREKERIYAPIRRKSGIDWKEFNLGINKVMQVYCGDIRNEESLKVGLKWLDELKEQEVTQVYARNPHELGRALESLNLVNMAEMVIHASLARKASSAWLNFFRSDCPKVDPPEWRKWITTKLDGDKVKVGELPIDYWGELKKNYEAHCGL